MAHLPEVNMKVIYGYRTVAYKVGKNRVPALELFTDVTDENPDGVWLGRIIGRDEKALDDIFNRIERSVELD